MQPLQILILIFFIIDQTFTYLNVVHYRKLFPKKDWTKMELNPIVRSMWQKFGLLKGGVISLIIQTGIIIFLLILLNKDILLILTGAYIIVTMIHIDNYILIKAKEHPKKKTENNWRKYAVIIILTLGIIDLGATFYYVHTYKTWQPLKPYEAMELNPLLLFLWNNLGLTLGMLIGGVIMLTLQYYVAKKLYWLIVGVLFLALAFTLWNHYNNISLLHQLIKQYPLGHI
jgi:hypothetical protein